MWAYIINGVAIAITTVVFCFWCVYLLETTRIKRGIYTRAKACTQGGYSHQQHLVYNAKTELVKYVFLFVMNLIEWLAFTLIRSVSEIEFVADNTVYGNSEIAYRIHYVYNRELIESLHMLGKSFTVLSTVLFACLCRYLSARYSPESWINSNGIPQLFCIFAVYLVVNQIITTFSPIMARWFTTFLLTSSIILAMQESRKLIKVIDRTILDLQISQINVRLLKRQVSTRRTFHRMFITLCIGTGLLLLSEYIENVLLMSTALVSYEQGDKNGILSTDVYTTISKVVKIITDLAYYICILGTACYTVRIVWTIYNALYIMETDQRQNWVQNTLQRAL